jgi:large subunit ribosomal protein L4e
MSDAPAKAAPPATDSAVSARPSRVHLVNLQGKAGASVDLPKAFSEPVRPDLIRRAVVAAQSLRIQPHGVKPTAGARHSVRWSGKGKGVARTPRLMDSMRGAQAPNTVGGRAAHPPKVEKIWSKKINTKERHKAFASALAATRVVALAKARGHEVPEGLQLPVVGEAPLEDVAQAADARAWLLRMKIWADIERAGAGVHVRAGRGKRRGRLRRSPRSLLVVTSEHGKARGFANLSGVDVVPVARLGTEDLAPGGDPGRLTVFTAPGLDALRSRLEGPSP